MKRANFTRKAEFDDGFTLVELIIALAIGGVVLGSVMASFISQHRNYLAQNEIVELQENGRIAIDMIARDIRTAGYDPDGNLNAGFTTATATSFAFTRFNDVIPPNDGLDTVEYALFDAFTADANNDGKVDDLGLKVTTHVVTGVPQQEVVAENISQIYFRYLNKDGEVIATPVAAANLSDIRSVQVYMLAEAAAQSVSYTDTHTYSLDYTSPLGALDSPAPWGPMNDSFRRHLFFTTVKCRNLGL